MLSVRDDLDPDEAVAVPRRELAAAINLLRQLASVMDSDAALAQALAGCLTIQGRDGLERLPEVGPVTDEDGLRLFLHRLHDRLARLSPDAVPALPPPPVTVPAGTLRVRRPSRSAAVVNDDLADAFVWWDDITAEDVEAYREVLSTADDERPLQKHLALNPILLVQHMGGGHGRWVISQKRLGAEYIPDFVIAERSSSGFEWQFVELQSPRARLFVPSSGRQSEQLDEGLRQIAEWRRWLADNRDYARRPRACNGLGLVDASDRDPGLLIIGREAGLTELDRQRRRQLGDQLGVRIRTYDWLVREAEARLAALHRGA
jgi:Domain of unknown function (DUF4263)